MKRLLFILFLLLSFPALADDATLPEKYLGYWKPMSKPLAGMGIDIRKNGIIYDILDSKKDYLSVTSYRFIGEDKGFAYIAAYHSDQDYTFVEVWQLHKKQDELLSEKIDKQYVLYVNDKNCGLTLKSFATFSRKALWKMVTKECQFNQDPYNEGDMVVYVRKEER